MAARLTVVICQGNSQGSAASDLEESLVAELMMKPGMDVTMIGELQRVDVSDTDYLCLSSFNHSFAMVSWLSVAEVEQQWQRLGLMAQVVDVSSGGMAGQDNSGNRVFHLQLQPETRMDQVMTALDALLASRNVQTVSLGALSPKATVSPKAIASDAARAIPTSPVVSHPDAVTQSKAALAPPAPNGQAAHSTEDSDEEESAEDAELDQLVDDFDALDL